MINSSVSADNFLAAAVNGRQEAVADISSRMNKVEQSVRSQVTSSSAKASIDETVVTNLKYSVGADGKLYVTGADVAKSRKTTSNEPQDNQNPSNQQSSKTSDKPPIFSEINSPRINISPFELAKMQEDKDNHSKSQNQSLEKLKATDARVRSHEALHFNAAAGLADGGAKFDLVQGSDGKFYAVGGHVDIRTTNTSSPQKSASDASTVARAANAPADGSAQDFSVARSSSQQTAEIYNNTAQIAEQPLFNLVG